MIKCASCQYKKNESVNERKCDGLTTFMELNILRTCPARFGYVLPYFPLQFGKKLIPMRGKLVNNNQTLFLKYISVPEYQQSVKGVCCWLVFELILLFVDIVYWKRCLSLFWGLMLYMLLACFMSQTFMPGFVYSTSVNLLHDRLNLLIAFKFYQSDIIAVMIHMQGSHTRVT